MTNRIIIEDLLQIDKEAVRQLLLDSYKQYEEGSEGEQGWADYMETIRTSVDNKEIDRILVAKANEDIVGTLQLFDSSVTAYGRADLQINAPIVRLLAVHPKARGQGVAQALLRESLIYAQEKGAPSLYLHSSDAMEKAIRLYEWLGFERDVSKEFHNRNIHVKCFRYDLVNFIHFGKHTSA